MRIAWVIYGSLELVSGGFLYDRKVVECLRAAGAEVDVVELPWPGLAGQLALNLRRLAWPRPPESYHAIVEDQLAHPSLIAHNLRLRARGAKVIALVHNLTVMQPATRHKWLRGPLETAYLRGVDGVIAVCESTRADALARRGPLPSTVAYAGRDHVEPHFERAAHQARAHEPGPLRVLFLANVLPHKGLHHLLAALALVPRSVPVALHVVGTLDAHGPYGREIRAMVRHADLANLVTFRGQLLGAELERAIASCHVLALPSDREAYPLSCLEALAFGLPVLTTCHGGTGELVRDGVEGHLLAPHDHAGWARVLAGLAQDRSLLARMGEAAHARWRAHGTWADTARVVAEFVTTLR